MHTVVFINAYIRMHMYVYMHRYIYICSHHVPVPHVHVYAYYISKYVYIYVQLRGIVNTCAYAHLEKPEKRNVALFFSFLAQVLRVCRAIMDSTPHSNIHPPAIGLMDQRGLDLGCKATTHQLSAEVPGQIQQR